MRRNEDARKYLPQNYHASEFGHPPTEEFNPQIMSLGLFYADKINTLLKDYHASDDNDVPQIRVGTELEIFLFSDEYDPSRNGYVPSSLSERSSNPNYKSKHEANTQIFVSRMGNSLQNILFRGHPIIEPITQDSPRFIEARTKPAPPEEYIRQMTRIENFIQIEAENLHINPIVHSQHIHMSITNNAGDKNVMKNMYRGTLNEDSEDNLARIYPSITKGLTDMYHRLAALIMLPEEMDITCCPGHSVKGISANGYGSSNDPVRIEGRLNSSEYAFNPYLNLLVNLIGIYRGLQFIESPADIDKDYPLDDDSEFKFGKSALSYQQASDHMLVDEVISDYIPSELLQGLHEKVSHYWEISKGDIPAAEIRDHHSTVQRR